MSYGNTRFDKSVEVPSHPAVNTTPCSGVNIINIGQQPDFWQVVEYELSMLRAARGMLASPPRETALLNMIAESLLLHTRNLCELFLAECARRKDDIKLTDLFVDWEAAARYEGIKKQMAELLRGYGESGDARSVKWALNKRLAHLTRPRAAASGYDYTHLIAPLMPLIERIFAEIEILRGIAFQSVV